MQQAEKGEITRKSWNELNKSEISQKKVKTAEKHLTCGTDLLARDLVINKYKPWVMWCLVEQFDTSVLKGCEFRAIRRKGWPLTPWSQNQ